jgi:putative Mn2+ efflux pump MntP
MSLPVVLGIALALAMDAFAVAVAGGVSATTDRWRPTLRLAWHFGLFQSMMTAIGWVVGLAFRSLIERFDHWAAFALLAAVGGHMIVESRRSPDGERRRADPTKGLSLVMLSVATSVDALAVGLSFAVLGAAVAAPAAVIGVVAATMTVLGMRLGRAIGRREWIAQWAEAAGGLVLLGIGVNILREHGVF